jgi:ribosomal protein S18 acetylase RimI-like enzyme
MNISPRHYLGVNDQPPMIDLACQSWADTLHVIDLPYRLSSWALDDPANVNLWVDEGHQLAAWAIMQSPFWTIDFVIRPSLENDLLPQVLGWADQRAREMIGTPYGHPSWFVNVFPDQLQHRRVLEHHGFSSQSDLGADSWSQVWMELKDNPKLPEVSLPVGYHLRNLAGTSEVAAYVELHQSVFESKNMTPEWRLRTLHQPGYTPELDVVIASPAGNLVAFCIGWLAQSKTGRLHGQIEPMGCRSEFRKLGLGKQVLYETILRLRTRGAQSVFVETDNYRDAAFHLYESLGFRVVREVLVYGKDYNGRVI